MARKRMFDNDIINQDSFLDLPTESKALYFLLGMEADDEGFVAPKRVMRLHNIAEDNLKVLIAKNYVIQFKSGVVVITDWKRNNYLDKNKMKPTIYVDEKKMLDYNEVKQQYLLNAVMTMVKPKLNQSLPKVKQKLTQYSIEENSIDEYSIDDAEDNIIYNNIYNKSVKKITKCYEDNIGLLTPASAEKIFSYLDDFEDYNLIITAIKKAALNNKRSANYICGILESWKRKGYKVIADIQNEQRKKTKEETEDEKIARQVKELEEAIKKDELTGIYTSNSKS